MKRLIKLVLLVAAVGLVAKKLCGGMGRWQGMSESDVRSKLDAKLGDRVPDEKLEMIADKIVAKMREKGVLTDESAAATETAATDAAEPSEDAAAG